MQTHRQSLCSAVPACAVLVAVFLCAAAARALDPQQNLRHYGYQSWQTDNGLPQNTVHAVAQGHDGFMWFGTEAGLVRFDSVRFRVYTRKTTPQLPSNLIYALMEDHSGSLWIGTANGIARYSNGTFHGYPDTAGSIVWSLFQDHSGRVWAATSSGLSRQDGSGFINVPGVPPLDEHSRLLELSDGSLWLSTTEGLFHAAPGNATYFTLAGAPAPVEAIALDRSGRVWAGTRSGVEACNMAGCESIAALANKRVHSLAVTPQGGIWIGGDQGLWFYDPAHPSKIQSYSAKDGLPASHVNLLFRDREGALWIGTSFGVARLVDGKIESFTPREGFSSNMVLSIAQDREGNLWLGTESGGVDILRDRKFTTYTAADGISDDHILAVTQDRAGTVWLGTDGGGLDSANPSAVNQRGFSTLTTADGLSSNIILSLAAAPNGDLWVGTPDGLDRLRGGKIRAFTSADGLADDFVRSLHFDTQGTLWIGTNGGGLDRWRNGVFQPVRPQGADLPANIYSILSDDSGHLWISSNEGIDRVSLDALNRYIDGKAASLPVQRYGTADGMKISEASSGGHPAAWRLRNGALWFATLKGVATVNPSHLDTNRVPPLMAIVRFSVDDQPEPAPASGPLKIAAGSRRFAFDYAALSFAAPNKVRFRYRLDGFDHKWIDAGSERSAYYTNLPPGHYKFEVMASNNDGVWSAAPATLAFQLRPYFYQTIWFYLLLIVAAALLGYAAYLWRVRQVESRFNAVLAERNRIAREIHDTLAQGFVAVSVQLQLAKQLLSSSGDAARESLDEAQNLVKTGLDDARRAIWELRSQGEESRDLASQLVQMSERVTGGSNIKPRVEVRGTYRPLSERAESELLRIAQEAVTNAVRHSQASAVEITLKFSRRRVSMTIADNGRGFTGAVPSVPDGHFGLTGMSERAQQIGGTVTITSSEGEGTRVRVEVPTGSETR